MKTFFSLFFSTSLLVSAAYGIDSRNSDEPRSARGHECECALECSDHDTGRRSHTTLTAACLTPFTADACATACMDRDSYAPSDATCSLASATRGSSC